MFEHCIMCIPWVRYMLQIDDTFEMKPKWKKVQSVELPVGGNWMQHDVDLASGIACFSQSVFAQGDVGSKLHFVVRDDESSQWNNIETTFDSSYGRSVTALTCRRNNSLIEGAISFADDPFVYHRISMNLSTQSFSVAVGPLYNVTNSSALEISTIDLSVLPQYGSSALVYATEKRSDWERSSYLGNVFDGSDESFKKIGPTNADFSSSYTNSMIWTSSSGLVVNIASASLMTIVRG
jgi:hypothetical protein